MKNNADISTLLKPIGRSFRKFHTTIFIVAVVAGLAYVVLSVTSIISSASVGTSAPSTGTEATLDSTTIERLGDFHTSDAIPAAEALPAGRVNPFNE